MTEKICAILPYKELFEIAEYCKNQKSLDIKVKRGNLEEAIPLAIELERKGAEVIISRGGTAALIRKHVHIPVVEIKVTYLDILRILYPFRDKNNTLLVVGFKDVVNGSRLVGSVLNVNLKEIIIPYEDKEYSLKQIIQSAEQLFVNNNISGIVGDTAAVINLENLCKNICLITSGKEAFLQAVDEANNIVRAKKQEKEKSKKFQAVLDFINDGVISTDEHGIITVFNPTAERIFDVKKEMAIGSPIRDVINEEFNAGVLKTNMAELEKIQNAPKGTIMINTIPINVGNEVKGVVSTFKEVSKIQVAEQKIRENLYVKGFVTRYSFKDILTKDPRVKKMIQMAEDYAKTNATILIEGESGTGKEVFAQSIHAKSSRSKGPFIALNCAALPWQLLESELFGYVEGAFTGAAKGGKVGLFEMAHNGTIFLDEIGEIDKSLQARFLRVLEEKQIMRIGSDKIVPVNVRVIAATNLNLRQQVMQGGFRADLYYRLNVLNLYTIPLRERKVDIEYLANYFIRISNKKYGLQVEKLSDEVIEFLQSYSWPGNIREMKNVIERIVLTTRKDIVRLSDIELIVSEIKKSHEMLCNTGIPQEFLQGSLNEIKKKVITKVLKEEGYNKSRAARRLEIDRSTLDRLL